MKMCNLLLLLIAVFRVSSMKIGYSDSKNGPDGDGPDDDGPVDDRHEANREWDLAWLIAILDTPNKYYVKGPQKYGQHSHKIRCSGDDEHQHGDRDDGGTHGDDDHGSRRKRKTIGGQIVV